MEILIAVLIIVVVWLGIDVFLLNRKINDLQERADVMGDNQYNKFNNAFDRILQIESDNKKLWGTVKLLTRDNPAKPVKKVTPETPKFKKGQWILRQWDKANGGEIDLAKFDKKIGDFRSKDSFSITVFYRFYSDKVEEIIEGSNIVSYYDYRMSTQWRAATKAEIEKYTKLIAKKK